MTHELRICPHCGASVSGETSYCPRCDGLLDDNSKIGVPVNSALDEETMDEDEAAILLLRPPSATSDSKKVDTYQGDGESQDELIIEANLSHHKVQAISEELSSEDHDSIVDVNEFVDAVVFVDGEAEFPDEVDDSSVSDVVEIQPEHEESVEEWETLEPQSDADIKDELIELSEAAQTNLVPDTDTPYIDFESDDNVVIIDADTAEFDAPTGEIEVIGEAALADMPDITEEFLQPLDMSEESTPEANFEIAKKTALGTSLPRPQPAEPVPEPEPLPALDTQPKLVVDPIPPAPFTLPPQPPQQHIAPDVPPSVYWFQQRIEAYRQGGYTLKSQNFQEAVLNYGKPLSYRWWIIAMASVIGILWYFMILLMSGFKRDVVVVTLEPDGYVYEDGNGAAHIRRRRSRVARRWGVLGFLIMIFSIFTVFLVAIAGFFLTSQYEAEMTAAYPEAAIITNATVTNCAEADSGLDCTEVQNVKVVILALIILIALSGVGLIGGFIMAFVSYLQSAAYSVDVAPLPDH